MLEAITKLVALVHPSNEAAQSSAAFCGLLSIGCVSLGGALVFHAGAFSFPLRGASYTKEIRSENSVLNENALFWKLSYRFFVCIK